MTDRSELIPYEHLRLFLLDEAGANTELGVVWGRARKRFAAASEEEFGNLFVRAIVDLHDAALITLFRAPQPEGYGLGLSEIDPLGRDEVLAELRNLIADIEPAEFVWVVETKRGADFFERLPPEAVAEVRGREPIDVTMERIAREHPEFLEKRDQYFRDVEEWVNTGKGKQPRMPDWPGEE